ncbi:F-box/LRR-repeat protein 12 [Apostasia shenzhenica]|uniref:F-box/LRR-repeat protein 12 n=1 Tax=Apostasia shenzhenica TaxID=1088818 RepID=A0A2I0AZ68_9ASPA|nr:F-box/LRR-repeat protein 12 [Apostasia shenzhenica]
MSLPHDCLVDIFQKLHNNSDRNAFGLTCRHWLHIQNISRRSLSLHFSYNTNVYQSYITYVSVLLNCFPQLSSVSIAGCPELPDPTLARLCNLRSTLYSLSLDCCLSITDIGLTQVVMQCTQLVSLTLYRCNITDMGLKVVAAFCKSLEKLNLSYCLNITDDGITAISNGCCLPQVLVVSYCRGIIGTGFRGCSPTLGYIEAECCMFTNEGLSELVTGGGLKYLNLSSPRCSSNFDGIALGLASRLRFLNLRLCRFISDDAVVAIANGCLLLEEWNLAVCHEVGVTGWAAIGSKCTNLKVLHVNRCRNLCDTSLLFLRDGCDQLQVLHIHGCHRVSQMGLEFFKLRRQDVDIRVDECISIGQKITDLFA